ncbi:NUDIX hydrolase [Pontiellaceae bacterium B1224]|nr:NUDIX hydrolase [Pontiellaceae bacterium B1224]
MSRLSKQYGVIPFVRKNGQYKLVLVTSRTNGYWIFPKGNPVKGKDKYESAIQEAFEEAGVKGALKMKHSYSVTIPRKGSSVELELFPMEVSKLYQHWPEKKERKRRVVSLRKAEKLLSFDELIKCEKKWTADFQR